MALLVLFNAALAGFFAFAAVHYVIYWWLSRRESTFLIFSVHCALCGLLSGYRVGIASATTIPAMDAAFRGRTTLGLLITATAVCILSRLTGVRARRYVTFILCFCLPLAVLNAFVLPLNGPVTQIDRLTLPWGEEISIPTRSAAPWWMALVFMVIVSVYIFGMLASLRLWVRDRIGGVIVGLASTGGLFGIVVAYLADVGGLKLPYIGALPQALSVVMIALLQSRDYVYRNERLIAGEASLRAFIDSIPEPAFLIDVHGVFLVGNEALATSLRRDIRDIIGQSAFQFFPPEIAKARVALLEDVCRTRRPRVVEDAGSGRYFINHLSPVIDGSGNVNRVAVLALDITERKRAEESLRESEARYRTLVEYAPETILVLDMARGVFVDANENACRMFSMSRDELLRLGPLDLSPPSQPDGCASAEKARRHLERALAGEAVRTEWVCRDRSGRDIPCEISLVRLPSAERPLIRGSIIDLTQTKKLQEQFRQAQKMEAVGQLAGGIAHDFNNLLTIIFGYGEALLAKLPSADPLRGAVDSIMEAGDRAASLTRQLLAFSRQQVLQPKALNLNSVISKTETMLRRLIGEDVILTADLDPQLGIVKADPSQLEQVLMNLAVNSRDAMPKGGRLTIETRNVILDETFCRGLADLRPGPYAMLTVIDSGTGMDEATKARAFEPFFTTKGPGKGTGLGLATVHGIVKQSGGHVEVFSEVSGGTTIKIFLPQIEAAQTVLRGDSAVRDMPRGNETVLLVEDEEPVRALGQQVLKSCGYDVLVAQDGNQALEVANAHPGGIDLLVSDVVMPHLGGKQLAEQITALRPMCRVLFLSGYTADAVIREGVGESEFEFLQKPFTPLLLAKKVREVLDRGSNSV